MKPGSRVFSFFDKMNGILTFLAGGVTLFLTLLISADVVMRYFFNHPLENVDEITEHALLYLTFLSAAWVLKKGGHVQIDIIYNQLGPRLRAFLDLLNPLLGAAVCLALTWFSVDATWLAFKRGTVFATTWSLPRWPILMVIPVGSFLLFIQFLQEVYANVEKRKSCEDDRPELAEK
jgi:C4-dicarboxylate transporter, DctQ subunit